MAPVIFLSHGAPPLADDLLWSRQLASWSAELPTPTDILIISAHWEDAPPTLSSTTGAPLVYDFWGFPKRYYDVTYPTPPAAALAAEVAGLLAAGGIRPAHSESRGLDHGAYVPLKEMYPSADVPVVQLSMPSLDPTQLFDLGVRLTPLRERGTLIVGSGFTTHNLRGLTGASDSPAPRWSVEFDDWARRAMADNAIDDLLDFGHTSPNASVAHPRTEHFVPLFVALGAALARGDATATSVIDGFWFGLSKRSWQLE